MRALGPRGWAAIAVALFLVGAIRIRSTARLFTETLDEGTQVACGLQWLTTHQYQLEAEQPPLSRGALAIGPALDGARIRPRATLQETGTATFGEAPDYYRLLSEARAGNLIFFAFACVAVWLLGLECGGPKAAAATVACLTLIPAVLGHAGVATTDLSLAATLPLAFWSWQVMLLRPDRKRVALCAVSTALAILSKFSSLLFLPAILVPLLVMRWRSHSLPRLTRGNLARGTAFFAAIGLTIAWATYWFEVVPIRTPPDRQFLVINTLAGTSGRLHDFLYRLLEIPFPLSAVFKGIGEVYAHNFDGHSAYLFGHYSEYGWWYFFPVVLLIKTPLPLLALGALGIAAARRGGNTRALECLAATLAMLISSFPAHINIGIRHILPIYALAVPLAGLALVQPGRRGKLAIGLFVCLIAVNIQAHPHYLADFNLLAGDQPEKIVTDSDLDWGQDLPFATQTLRQRGVQDAWLAYRGVYDATREQGIRYRELPPLVRTEGWIAISVSKLYFEGAMAVAKGQPEPYGWLKSLTPVARAGRSILIYHVPAGARP